MVLKLEYQLNRWGEEWGKVIGKAKEEGAKQIFLFILLLIQTDFFSLNLNQQMSTFYGYPKLA